MSALEEKAVDLLDKFENLAAQYAPDVIDAAMGVVMINGIQSLVFGVLGLVYLLSAPYILRRCQDASQAVEKWDEGMSIIAFTVIATAGIMLTAGAVISMFNLIDIWNYVAIFDPKLALAHKLLGV